MRALLAEQFPEWAELPLARVEPTGTVNVIYRLGDELARAAAAPRRLARLQRTTGAHTGCRGSHRSCRSRSRAGRARPAGRRATRGTGRCTRWLEGETADRRRLPPRSSRRSSTPLQADRRAAARPSRRGGRGKPLACATARCRDALEHVEAPGRAELWDAGDAARRNGRRHRVWLHCDLDAATCSSGTAGSPA